MQTLTRATEKGHAGRERTDRQGQAKEREKHVNRQTEEEISETERQPDRMTHTQTIRNTGRQTDR